tara:strand:- start:1461 stop:2489 length:1029 start_codon:yes stop_codon:yes gene_type:complete
MNLLELDESQARQLYIETWIDRKYEYEQFVEWSEGKQTDKKFVNISKDGRKISNNKVCQKNFYFYGGSTTFGYNVTDYQTFAQYFKDLLDQNFSKKEFCVFNHGRAGFASPWETILFQKHLNEKRINEGDFVFFIDGVNERGLTDGINSESLKLYQNAATYKYWNMYKPTFSIFLQSLPFTQLVLRLKQKNRTGSKNLDSINCPANSRAAPVDSELKCISDNDIAKTLENFVKIRTSICNDFSINCFTMLQPISTVHGKYFENYEKSPAIETGMLKDVNKHYQKVIGKYNLMKKVKGVIDISTSLDNETTLSYVDRSHYSPEANKAIANYIFLEIKDNINER